MEALEIESQTDQTPLTSSGLNTSQGELAKAEHLFDDANHRAESLPCHFPAFMEPARTESRERREHKKVTSFTDRLFPNA